MPETTSRLKSLRPFWDPRYLALASFVALLQFRVILMMLGPHHKTTVAAAAAVIRGEPLWRIFQSRLLGPYLVKAVSFLTGNFTYAHVFCSVAILTLAGYFVLVFLKKTTGDEGKTLGGYFLFSLLVFFCISGPWMFIWDLLDILIFVLFNYFVLTRKDYRYFSVLFLFAILNQESAYIIAVWMILDPCVRRQLAAPDQRRPLDLRMIASGLTLLAIGIALTEHLRSALLVRETGPVWLGAVKGAGPRFHYLLPQNLAALKTALTTLRTPLLFFIPLFWAAYTAFCVRFITRNPGKHLALGAAHLIILGSVLIYKPAFLTPVYLALLPFVALNFWTVLSAPTKPGEEKTLPTEDIKAAAPFFRSSGLLYLVVFLAASAAAITQLCTPVDRDRSPRKQEPPEIEEKQERPKSLAPSPAPQPRPAPPRPVFRRKLPKGPIDDEKLNEMAESLSAYPGKPVWFATDLRNRTAIALQRQLENVFKVAGWEVRSNTGIRFTLRSGIFFFIAAARPPRYVLDAKLALERAGLKMRVGTDYRAFTENMKKKNPAWRGISLAPEQTFVIVIGPQK